MDTFKWCFIGAGTLAKGVAKELCRSGRHELVSVYTRRFEAGQEFAAKYGGTAYRTPEEAIRAPGVDAVYVVTPHTSHFQYAKTALELGKPVLCEKPFTVAAPETEELIRLAREKGVYIAEAMWTWFGEAPYKVKSWLDEGELGQLTDARLTYCMWSMGYAPRVTDPKLAGGALLDVGVYPLTYLYRLFGYPETVTCKGRLKGGIDLGEELELVFKNGLRAQVSVAIDTLKGLEKLTIRGEKGVITQPFYHCSGAAKLRRLEGKNETFHGAAGYLNEFDRVSGEIRKGLKESEYVPLKATTDVMRLMDECRRQMGLKYEFED